MQVAAPRQAVLIPEGEQGGAVSLAEDRSDPDRRRRVHAPLGTERAGRRGAETCIALRSQRVSRRVRRWRAVRRSGPSSIWGGRGIREGVWNATAWLLQKRASEEADVRLLTPMIRKHAVFGVLEVRGSPQLLRRRFRHLDREQVLVPSQPEQRVGGAAVWIRGDLLGPRTVVRHSVLAEGRSVGVRIGDGMGRWVSVVFAHKLV